MKRGVAYTVLGVLTYVVFVVILFPADRAYSFAKETLDTQGIKLYGVSGTVWSGQANGVVVDGELFREGQWTLKPWTVVLGRVDVDWAFDNGDAWGSGTAGFGINSTIRLRGVEGQFPAGQLKRFFSRLPVELMGTLELQLDDATYDATAVRLSEVFGSLVWNNAKLAGITEESLGSFLLTVETEQDVIKGTLKDGGQGPLAADGLLTLNQDNSYQFNATFAARDPKRQDLVRGLQFLGRSDSQGKVSVQHSGVL